MVTKNISLPADSLFWSMELEKIISRAKTKDPVIVLETSEYDALIEDLEDRLAMMERADEPTDDLSEVTKKFDEKFGITSKEVYWFSITNHPIIQPLSIVNQKSILYICAPFNHKRIIFPTLLNHRLLQEIYAKQ